MRLELYQMMDNVAGHVTGPIIIAPTDAFAIRLLKNTLQDPKQEDFRRNIRDYNLLHIGQQNEETGHLETQEIRTVITGAQMLATMDNGS